MEEPALPAMHQQAEFTDIAPNEDDTYAPMPAKQQRAAERAYAQQRVRYLDI